MKSRTGSEGPPTLQQPVSHTESPLPLSLGCLMNLGDMESLPWPEDPGNSARVCSFPDLASVDRRCWSFFPEPSTKHNMLVMTTSAFSSALYFDAMSFLKFYFI